jgi:hypothetical protein
MVVKQSGSDQHQESPPHIERILHLQNAATQLEILINKMRARNRVEEAIIAMKAAELHADAS